VSHSSSLLLQEITQNSNPGKRVRRRRQVIHSKEREIIRNVLLYFDQEAKDIELSLPIQEEDIFKHGCRITTPLVLNTIQIFATF
jgi:hypothetical protein